MIYQLPPVEDGIDQGDVVDDCPLLYVVNFDVNDLASLQIRAIPNRVLVLAQTCDLANQKVSHVAVAAIHEARKLVEQQKLKAADVRGPLRAGRVFGWYFLPKNDTLGLPEMIVDLQQLHSVRLDLLDALCRQGKRRARLVCPYREHLAKHFTDTYSRIGLPEPYETE